MIAGMVEMTVCVKVIAKLPVRLPASQQPEPRHQTDSDYIGSVVSPGFGGRNVSDLVRVVETPDLIGKLEVDAFEDVSDVVSSGSEGDS